MMAFSNLKMNHKLNNLTLYLIVKTTKFQLKISSTPGGGRTSIWNRRGCSSEIFNLTPKGDHQGVAQAFCDP